MNHINSCLIEGIVHIEPTFFVSKKFVLASNFYIKKEDNTFEKEILFIDIYIGNNLLNCGFNNITKDSELRITGRLKKIGNKIVVEAEHIDFQNIIRKENTNV